MRSSSLQSKTVRPGLGVYSFYASSRATPAKRGKTAKSRTAKKRADRQRAGLWLAIAIAIVLAVGFKAGAFSSHATTPKVTTAKKTVATTTKPAPKLTPAPAATTPAPAAAPVATGPCGSNILSRFILVSISQRHLWACQAGTAVYDSPVITGMQNLAADLTPTGTYRVYSKQTNVTLTGSDTTGSWNDPVSYWMPFLYNQYGTYGFHDATWRPDSAFGNVDPYSSDGSHGCVELPLATAKWLYDWSYVGTTVTIRN
jgi:lipoprotein-anchoring transpeptidase ErfK/SrfK